MNTEKTLDPSQTMLDLHDAINQLRARPDDEAHCSFCGKRQSDVTVLVPGPNSVYICDKCVDRCAKLIGQRM